MFTFKKKKNLTNEEKILECLKKEIKGSKIKANSIFLSKYDLTIESHIKKINEDCNPKMLTVEFVIKHESLNEPFIEANAGVGKTIDDALAQSVANFSMGAFCGFKNCIDGESSKKLETDFFNQKKSWCLTESYVQGMGEKDNEEQINFWSIIGEKIKVRLGNKKIYWVKVYAAKLSNGKVSCECSINGVLNNEITMDIKEYAKEWNIKTDFCSLKQYFIIKQDDETYNKYMFSEDTVKEITNKAIKIIADCNCEEQYSNLDNEIYKISGDINLAYEIRSFIPEILCELVFNSATYTDNIKILKENEENNTNCYKNQFTSYKWIHDAVASNYYNSKLTEKEVKNIVFLSAIYNVLNNAVKQGAKIENLRNVEMGLCPFEGYIPS